MSISFFENKKFFNFNKYLIYLFLVFFISRIFYYKFFNITFDSWTIEIYWQFFPIDLIKNDLLNSIIFNHYQPPFLNLLVGLLMKISKNYILMLNLIYLVIGYFSSIFIYLICLKFDFSKKNSLLISSLLLILPTTLLYENHLYKEYLTFFFLTWLFYYSIKLDKGENSFKNLINISISLSLLCLTRETFHIIWGYILIFILQRNLEYKKRIIIISIFTIIVLPFYLKNFFIYNKFGINFSSTFEHLSQKIDYVKEMENPNRHKKIREFTFGSYENYENFKKRTSKLFDVPLATSAYEYVEILNYKYNYKNKLTQSNTWFNEVWIEVDKIRKDDFILVLKEHPSLFLLNVINSGTRHLFTSSDYFNFTKHNADKMKSVIKISDCIKLTPICFYDYGFKLEERSIGGNTYMTIDTGPLSYKEKIIYSIQYTNFSFVIIYFFLFFYLIKGLLFRYDNDVIINFWIISFFLFFFIFIVFEDGEIARHRFPFDYLAIIIFLSKIKHYFKNYKIISYR